MSMASSPLPSAAQVLRLLVETLAPERQFLGLAIVYGIGISLLSLATPVAVQILINTVAHTGLTTPLIVLSVTLFGLLLASGLLSALRIHLMEVFGRRLYARLVAEISLKAVYARDPFFADSGRGPLFNRYFDIITVQKNIPILFIGGFTVLLQVMVGFLLVSFYHHLFMIFSLVIIGLIWLIWLIWGRGAIQTAVAQSQAKHRSAAWLEGLASSNGFYKSERHIAQALKGTDQVTATYVETHKRHFRRHFSQTLAFFLLYAAASAILLGLGGWLVIDGQLTLGQLVAAELVLSAAFFGVSQLGTYLGYFYDLCASVEELSLFDGVEQERPVGQNTIQSEDSSLSFRNVVGQVRTHTVTFNLELPGNIFVQGRAEDYGTQRFFTGLLKRFIDPKGGAMTLGGQDVTSIDVHDLRRAVVVLDRPNVIETTIRNYLTLSLQAPDSRKILEVLRIVGLDDVVADLPDGLDTELATTGWPLSTAEMMQLKLAATLLGQPLVLCLSQLFDMMPLETLLTAIAHYKETTGGTVVYFTNRGHSLGADRYLVLGRYHQSVLAQWEDYIRESPRSLSALSVAETQKTALSGGAL
ncbi:toxin secretion ABC transporter ATP-binding protein [Parvularcula bermudensis HTCC2503]|uniref:Toxin secretion ABC transporter ATP-binding protein n=1 Tax=Parvularcula bermudensis (strain ATCC BAA-594 / HTCC2503 / KCTC 12087) TaxID=314260 RepID=E0THE3_PARBH|nr:ABC transporter ATP-binding protein [Parvularcula bermudensis]ADM10735.1 toxin secretion ABC transporter ATP-binding protein [Parvularcula bermudensis HTCC2503]